MPLFVLLLAPGWPLLDAQQFPPAVQRAALAATVRIVPPGRAGIGSGVIVGRQGGSLYVLTVAHLLDRVPLQVEWFTADSYPRPAGSVPAQVVDGWKDIDLAVLTIPDNPALAPVPIAPHDAANATNVSALSVGCSGGAAPTCQADTVAGKKLVKRSGDLNRFFWEATPESALGRSGGPLLDRAGRLLGICSGNQSGHCYYVYLSELRHALKVRGLTGLLVEKSGP